MTALIRLLALPVVLLLASAGAKAGPWLLFEPSTGEVLSQQRAGEPWYPASLTKLMTAYLVFQKLKAGELKLDQKIPVSEVAASQPPSKLGIRAGGEITVDLALQAMLVYSANDIAVVLAEAAGGSVPRFVRLMNLAAQRLGMYGSNFANPNGLFDPRQVVTARDLGLLVQAILTEFPEHRHYFSQAYIAVGKRRLANRNMLVRTARKTDPMIPDGMKTGFVCNSGYNLVASASEGGRQLVAIILGERSGRARADLAQLLLASGFARAPDPSKPRVANLTDDSLGSLVPADLTSTVCKGKPANEIAAADGLTGWGTSFGQYETAQLADMALRGRMLAGRDFIEGGSAGVVKLAGSSAYSAMVWGLDQQPSEALCAYLRKQNAYCDVMTPDSFARIAAAAAAEPKPAPEPVAQGSDNPPAKAKAKAKKKKRKKRRS